MEEVRRIAPAVKANRNRGEQYRHEPARLPIDLWLTLPILFSWRPTTGGASGV
jgi:hypothetical protein